MAYKRKSKTVGKTMLILCMTAVLIIIFFGVYLISKAEKTGNMKTTVPASDPETERADKNPDESVTDEEEGSRDDDTENDEIIELINGMSLHEKVCQMFIVTPEGLTGYDEVTAAGDATRDSLKEYPVGGLIYFSKNLESPEQVRDMLSSTKEISTELGNIPMFFGVDEEGGDVARCAEKLGTTEFEPMFVYHSDGTETAYQNAKTIAIDISGLGFNLDFAPVADTWSNSSNTVIGRRAYSDDFKETAELVAAAVKGFDDGGVFCSLKHFPGHGDTVDDSHYGSAVSSKTADELAMEEYLAFEKGIEAGADMVMVGHITMTSIDDVPASISKLIITDELRGRIGYNGVVITDSLAMGAVVEDYSSGELAVKAVEAGVDILLMPADLSEAVFGLEEAVRIGEISEDRINESVERIIALKSKRIEINS